MKNKTLIDSVEITFNCNVLQTCRVEEEGAAKSTFQKQLRDLQTQMQELQEDLDAEKEARNKAEKLKRDLNEVLARREHCNICKLLKQKGANFTLLKC